MGGRLCSADTAQRGIAEMSCSSDRESEQRWERSFVLEILARKQSPPDLLECRLDLQPIEQLDQTAQYSRVHDPGQEVRTFFSETPVQLPIVFQVSQVPFLTEQTADPPIRIVVEGAFPLFCFRGTMCIDESDDVQYLEIGPRIGVGSLTLGLLMLPEPVQGLCRIGDVPMLQQPPAVEQPIAVELPVQRRTSTTLKRLFLYEGGTGVGNAVVKHI